MWARQPVGAYVCLGGPSRGLVVRSCPIYVSASTLPAPTVSADKAAPVPQPCDDALIRALVAVGSGLRVPEPIESDRRTFRAPDLAWSDLREALGGFTDAAKGRGDPPEHTIVRLKAIIAEVAPVIARQTALRSAVIRMCIDAYFRKA